MSEFDYDAIAWSYKTLIDGRELQSSPYMVLIVIRHQAPPRGL